jgi:hypothetical protein
VTDLTAPALVMGLRFRKSQRQTLRNVADYLHATKPPGVDISLFEKAAESAEEEEPLLVHCDSRAEVEAMAAWFVRIGVAEPSIEGPFVRR